MRRLALALVLLAVASAGEAATPEVTVASCRTV
jgi:hypothetical protein